MFRLTEKELQNGFEAIEHHGYSALLPPLPEWRDLAANWHSIRGELATIDLDAYHPVAPQRVYAPKNRATVRVASLLHPVDLIIFTSLVLIVADDLEIARIRRQARKVFSYRREQNSANRLYEANGSYGDFQRRLDERSARQLVSYVAIGDIADFYPRIYQHRLENVVESCARTPRGREVSRVLVRKLIGDLSGNNSYGIPVGPYASRVLGEAVLIDVDAMLASAQIDFVRWVDDYFIFTRSENEAQRALILLAQALYDRHGLTLSALKTKILTKASFRRRFQVDPDVEVDQRMQMISELSARFDPYTDNEVELTEEERTEFVGINILEIVERALEDRELVDYDTLVSLLRHPKLLGILPVEARKALGEVLLRNIEHLYPITEQVAEFFRTFIDLPWKDRKRIKSRLIASLLPKRGKWSPDYYLIWILDVLASEAWREASEYVRILRDHPSALVRRAATLAIAATGTRADAIVARDKYEGATALERLAILSATRKLGLDERRHWKRSLQLIGPLEKAL